MRITLDTNVLIAAFVAKGLCHDLFAHCALQHDLVTSQFILDELRSKLFGKFRQSTSFVEGSIAIALTRMRIVEPSPLPEQVCRDADDDWVLATAVAGSCDCLVTGDKDLLVLRSYSGIPILSPRDFQAFERDLNAKE